MQISFFLVCFTVYFADQKRNRIKSLDEYYDYAIQAKMTIYMELVDKNIALTPKPSVLLIVAILLVTWFYLLMSHETVADIMDGSSLFHWTTTSASASYCMLSLTMNLKLSGETPVALVAIMSSHWRG